MKRFIRYLYEYGQGKRMRNVGFVKVEQREDECMVHIHGKGLRMGSEKSLAIYLLFESEGKCFGIWQGDADNINPAVNECISYTAEDTGTPENYAKINGLVLENRDGRRYAALWNEKPVDISAMQIWNTNAAEETSQDISRKAEEPKEIEQVSMEDTDSQDGEEDLRDLEEPQVLSEQNDSTVPQDTEESEDLTKPQEIEELQDTKGPRDFDDIMGEVPAIRSEDIFFMDGPEKPKVQERWRTKKIQRTELAKLARCEWRLANNNFLLHGYYNYHHLILMERQEQLMLGVPGIYHEKEAAAAGSFGFAEFIAKDRLDVKLSPEECNEDHPFGYWCRPVKRAFKWE